MALGFSTTPAFGSRDIRPDKGMARASAPKVLLASFGDGYEQRTVDGINNRAEIFNISFINRTREEIDDITGYLLSLRGITSFNFTIPDSNNAGETTIKVVSDEVSQSYSYDAFYSASTTLRRVYEA